MTTTKQNTKTATLDTIRLRKALLNASAIKRNLSLPILSNIKGVFAQGKATLTSTDMERAIIIEIDSTNTEAFTALLQRNTVERFLTGGDGLTTLQQDNPLKVKIQREDAGTFTYETQKADDFPPVPYNDKLAYRTLDAKWFWQMIKIVSSACATLPENRPVLNAVACRDGTMAAADGFRLAVIKDKRLQFGLENKEAIIPLDTVILALRLFRSDNELQIAFETVKGQFSDKEELRRVYLKSGDTTLISELRQGTYPNYEQLIPPDFACKVSFSGPLMTQRLNMMDPLALPAGIVRFKFDRTGKRKEDECTLSSRDGEEIDYLLKLPVKIASSEPGAIAFNLKYVLDAIKPFSISNLEISSLSSPGKFTGDIDGLTIVVMPMFVQW